MKVEKTDDSFKSILLYGNYKTGKSLAAAKLAAHFEVFYFDLERNALSTIQTQLAETDLQNLNYFCFEDTPKQTHVIEGMFNFWSGTPIPFCEQHGLYCCPKCPKGELHTLSPATIPEGSVVVLDSGTQLTASATYKAGKGIDFLDPKTDKVSYGVWRTVGYNLDIIAAGIQNRKFHVILITHAAMLDKATEGKQIAPVLGTGNYSITSPRIYNEVCYLSNENRKFKISNTETNTVFAGSSSGLDISKLQDPTKGYFDLLPLIYPEKYKDVIETSPTPASGLIKLRR